ncbi:MAG TPA: hypothetical protein VG148_07015 [Pyrinomonadaceae bacterium]|nr:hypothetical protein [Pyrinomonadaceae bacterium]
MLTSSAHRRAGAVSLAVALASLCAALVFPAGALAQAKKPISKKGLINAVKINGLTTREFVREIETRGVDFEMTPSDEAEIRGAGARPEIVEAARANYRPPRAARPAVAANTTTPARPATPANTNVPAGPPLSKNEVVTMLQGGIPSARVEQFVEARGVTFQVTPEVAREITAAGGTRSLVGAITEKSVVAGGSGAPGYTGPVGADGDDDEGDYEDDAGAGGPSYDALIDQAQSSFLAQDYNNAGNYLRQAIEMDASRPIGFQLLGSWALVAGDFALADKAMRAAIERGGSASFRVAHDHDGGFGQYCEGSFFVSKAGVSFVANDGRDTFEAEDSNIKEVRMNRLVGANLGAFHVKPVQRINGRDNFNFAPLTTNKAEAELLISLVQAY